MSAAPTFPSDPVHSADTDCDCTLIEEHLQRCPGRPAVPLPEGVRISGTLEVVRDRQTLGGVAIGDTLAAPLRVHDFPHVALDRYARRLARRGGPR